MSKLILVLLLATVMTIAIVPIVAYSANDAHKGNDGDCMEITPLQPLSAEMEAKIKLDYLDFFTKKWHPEATADDVMIQEYCGTYNDHVAVMINDVFTVHALATGSETVDGVTIHYSDSRRILIWADGDFYRLQTAYDMGLLMKMDLIEISHHRHLPLY